MPNNENDWRNREGSGRYENDDRYNRSRDTDYEGGDDNNRQRNYGGQASDYGGEYGRNRGMSRGASGYENRGSYGNEMNRGMGGYGDDWNRGDSWNSGNESNRGSQRGGSSWGSSGGSSDWNRGSSDWNRRSGSSDWDRGSGGDWNRGSSGDWNRGSGNSSSDWNRGSGNSDWNRGSGRGSEYGERYGGANRGERDWWKKTKDEVSSWFGDEDAERRRRMDDMRDEHRGKGPKGYTRSDERIKEDINDRLSDDGQLDASDIEVSVSGCEVSLTGTVKDRWQKRRAEDLAEGISGVKNVENRLKVNQSADMGSGTQANTAQPANQGSSYSSTGNRTGSTKTT